MTEDSSTLSAEAQAALEAYHDMANSKQGYFSCLQQIEVKYKDGGKASKEEEDELGALLLVHDKCVTAFNQAMEKVSDQQDRMQLLKHMGG